MGCILGKSQFELCQDLEKALKDGDISSVKTLLLDNKTLCREHHMYVAVRSGHVDVVRLLLNHESSVFNTWGQSRSLGIAVRWGHVDVVRLLLYRGAHINARDSLYKSTPLGIAAEMGYSDIVELLLDRKACVHLSDIQNLTPLFKASYRGHVDIVRMLLDAGADINHSCNNITPLYIAARWGHTNVVKLLLSRGAHIDRLCGRGNDTALHVAIRYSHINIIRLLLNYGASTDIKNRLNTTPLHEVAYAAFNNRVNIICLLLNHRVSMDKDIIAFYKSNCYCISVNRLIISYKARERLMNIHNIYKLCNVM